MAAAEAATPAAADDAATPAATTAAADFLNHLPNLGLGYVIFISFGFLVLLSSILLASYIYCRRSSRHRRFHRYDNPTLDDGGVILQRIVGDGEFGNDADQNLTGGLDQSAIDSYPKFPFTNKTAGGETTTCSICLCDYKESEMLRMMPDCRHCFHLLCLDAWLKLNGSCPVCRHSPLPTPLSELVPLSQHGENSRRQR